MEELSVEVSSFASNLSPFWIKRLGVVSTHLPLPIEEGTPTPLLFTGLKAREVFFTPVDSKGAEPSCLLLAA